MLLFVGGLIAQNNMEISWQNCYGGSNYEEYASILETDFGYFILSTTDSDDGDITNYWGEGDIWLTAIDSVGNFLWGRCYGGSSVEVSKNIISDEYGYYYFGGWTASNNGDVQSGNHGEFDRWIVKINANGNILWEKCYGGTGSDYGPRLKMSSNGEIIAFSATTSNNGDVPVNYGYLDAWITIIDPENGNILKNKVFGNIGQNNIFDIVETRDGGFFLTSGAQEVEGMVHGAFHGASDVWAVKTDSNLNIEWQKLYGGTSIDYQGPGLLELEYGYIFLANTVSNDGDVSGFHGIEGDLSTLDIWLVRIDTVGNIIWEKCLGGSNIDDGWKIIQSDDGGFMVFAQTKSYNGDVVGLHITDYEHPRSDIWMLKLSSNGDIEWSRCIGGNVDDFLYYNAVIKKAEDNYVIVGSSPGSSPEYTEGDVDCDIKGGRDLWLFEIKDCENYMPAVPLAPNGPDTLCVTTDSTVTYSISPAAGAWSYEWQLVPGEAGNITSDSTTAALHWSSGWEGQAQINARSWNDCGYSDWSEVKNTWAYSCLGIIDNGFQGLAIAVFPNPAGNELFIQQLSDEINCTAQIYNLYGSKVYEFSIPTGQEQTRVDVSSYPSGVYIAVLITDTGILARRKFVKR